jgi:hypothetical protein
VSTTSEEHAAPTSTDRRRPAWAGPAAVAGGALAACAYVVANDPTDGAAFIPCPLYRLTGLWCPGCGLTRATHHLLLGDLAGALGRNLLLPLVIGLAVWAWVAWTMQSTGRPARGPSALPNAFWVVVGVTALAFAVVRNLPFGAALAP